MKNTYLFYDLETTGLNPCFDQVLQFAAIRTDLQFNELERHEIFVKLNPDCVPSPGAVITHRIDPWSQNESPCEYEAIAQIHALLNTPGTISLGYNTLGFDDEFLRFSFYRNLLTPYTHQYANDCSRMDIFPITALYSLYCRDGITWPTKDGKPSLKLELLSEANTLATGMAHDAMVDVVATVELAKKLAQHEQQWQYVTQFFNKQTDLNRQFKLPAAFDLFDARIKEAVCLSPKLGARNHYQAPVLALGQHQHYKNQTLWLRLDDDNLKNLTTDNVDDKSKTIRKRAGEAPFLLPPEERFLKNLANERLEKANTNKQWLLDNPNKYRTLCEFYQHYKYEDVTNADLDSLLYQRPFPTRFEQQQLTDFHQTDLASKPSVAEKFTDDLAREQAVRLLARNYPEHLPESWLPEWATYLEQCFTDGAIVDHKNHPKLTWHQAIEQAEKLKKENLDAQQQLLLDTLLRTATETA